MSLQVEVWVVTEPEKLFDLLKHVTDFGVAIAWIKPSNLLKLKTYDVGLVLPYTEEDGVVSQVTYRRFTRHMFAISRSKTEDGITSYDMPMSPYCPGDGGLIKREECLYVPPNFSSVTENE